MKSMIDIFHMAYTDVYAMTGASTSVQDLKYLDTRIEHEGLSFLTITLPTIADHLESGLRLGWWPRTDATAFAYAKGKAIPKFLSGLLRLVFDYDTGVLLEEPNVCAISSVRQLSRLFKKIEVECSEKRINQAYEKYLSTDSEVKPVRESKRIDLLDLRWVFSLLFNRPLTNVSNSIIDGTLLPKHGSGAVSEGFSQNGKYNADWYERLECLFPSSWYLHPHLGVDYYLSGSDNIPIGHELPAKVTHVPKTLKTPRLIAMEPTCIMYMQQALMRATYSEICDDPIVGRSLNLRDQSANGAWALEGSRSGKYATLDLSEASDRVGAGLVSFITKFFPTFREGIFRARSSNVSINRGSLSGTYRLKKFASMGSAMCFPIEAMVFLSIAVLVMHKVDGRVPTRRSVKYYARMCRVFGDDIIIPNHYAPSVCLGLTYFGLKVNEAKSFYQGKFRESCGVDAYDGYDITPIYVRTLPPKSTLNVSEVVSWVKFCNHLFERGLWKTSDYVRKHIEKTLRTRLPLVLATSPALGLISKWSKYYDQTRSCPVLHRPLVKAFKLRQKHVVRQLDGDKYLIKSLLRLGQRAGVPVIPYSGISDPAVTWRASLRLESVSAPSRGCTGIDREPMPRGIVINRGWTTPY